MIYSHHPVIDLLNQQAAWVYRTQWSQNCLKMSYKQRSLKDLHWSLPWWEPYLIFQKNATSPAAQPLIHFSPKSAVHSLTSQTVQAYKLLCWPCLLNAQNVKMFFSYKKTFFITYIVPLVFIFFCWISSTELPWHCKHYCSSLVDFHLRPVAMWLKSFWTGSAHGSNRWTLLQANILNHYIQLWLYIGQIFITSFQAFAILRFEPYFSSDTHTTCWQTDYLNITEGTSSTPSENFSIFTDNHVHADEVPLPCFLYIQWFRIRPGAVFGYTTLAHKEETDKTDKKRGEAVRQLAAWLGNTPAGPPERSPALGNVCAPVGKEDFKHKACATSTPLQLPLLLFSWAPWGISEDRPSSHHAMNQSRLSSCCHHALLLSLFFH